jgi:ankyrin repeat protein
MRASMVGHIEVVQALIAAKADVNVMSEVNPRLTSVPWSCLCVLIALLCDAWQRGHTALLIAVNTVHPEIVRALVKAGADVEVEKGRAERVSALRGALCSR